MENKKIEKVSRIVTNERLNEMIKALRKEKAFIVNRERTSVNVTFEPSKRKVFSGLKHSKNGTWLIRFDKNMFDI